MRNVLPGALCLLGSALLILRPLAAFWNRNDAYFFGWGVPLLALYLFYERWLRRPSARPVTTTSRTRFQLALFLCAWSFLLLSARLIIETEPESRPLLWLTASLLVGAVLAWLGLVGGPRWTRHFLFPVAFLFLGVPWVFRCEFFLIQGLMRCNAAAVADTLNLLDVPARAAGNTIVLADGQLGVGEACSGFRSLQATLMMSLFFGEFYRFPTHRRWLLLLLGLALALCGNYARMLFLAWKGASYGLASVEAMHGPAGSLILVFTVGSLWLICRALHDAPEDLAVPGGRAVPLPASPLGLRWAAGLFFASLFAEGVTQGWYGWRQEIAHSYPGWTIAWPVDAPGFHQMAIPPAVREQLRNDAAGAAGWRDGAGWSWTGSWFHYRAQVGDKIIFAAHNPELCLPAAGWSETEDHGLFFAQVGKIRLPVRGYRFTSPGETRDVFWIAYLDRGTVPYDEKARGFYGHSLAALAQLKFPFLADVWNGCRGAEAETLEVTVSGAPGYAESARALRATLARLVLPVTETSGGEGAIRMTKSG